jgi:hypothetical protein
MILVPPTRIGAFPGAAAAAIIFLCGAEGMESTWGRVPEFLTEPVGFQDWNILGLQF